MSDSRVATVLGPDGFAAAANAALSEGRYYLVTLNEGERHHLTQVLRKGPGDTVRVISQDSGMVYSGVLRMNEGELAAEIHAAHAAEMSRIELILVAGMIQADHADLLVEKAVELGVRELHFFYAARSNRVPQFSRAEERKARLVRVAQAAAKQSGNPFALAIVIHRSLGDVLHHLATRLGELGQSGRAHRIVCVAPEAGSQTDGSCHAEPLLRVLVHEVKTGDTLAAIVGPEGGLDSTELDAASRAGYRPVSLGSHTLRAETASIALAALTCLASDALRPYDR